MNVSVEASRFQTAIALADTGVQLMRQKLRRDDPTAADGEIDDRLRRWLTERPLDSNGLVRRPAR